MDEFLDGLISVVIVLFILSVITEKFTQLVRHYPNQCQKVAILLISAIYVVGFYSYYVPVESLGPNEENIDFTDLLVLLVFNTIILIVLIINLPRVKASDNAIGKLATELAMFQNVQKDQSVKDEGAVEREVTVLSFVIGFVVSYLFNASMISLVADPKATLGWTDVGPFIGNRINLNACFFGFDIFNGIGFVITGFFLSFGSKFFHDLLDTLLQTKNLKRKLNDNELVQVGTIKEFDQRLAIVDSDMVRITHQNHAAEIMANPHVKGTSCGSFEKDGKMVYGIKIFASNPGGIPWKQFTYALPNGMLKAIPVLVIEQSDVARVSSQILPSDNASNRTRDSIGSICFAVKETEAPFRRFLLTCYHVVKGDRQFWEYFMPTGTDEDQVTIKHEIVGDIYKGLRNREMDAALISVAGPLDFRNSVPEFNTAIRMARPVYDFDDDRTVVQIYGAATRQKRKGMITGVSARHKINFGEATPFEMVNLFEIQDNEKSIAIEGDSGALVFTEAGEALGMVVAVSDRTTLAIPLYTILANWKLQIDV